MDMLFVSAHHNTELNIKSLTMPCVEFAGCVSPGDSGGPLFSWFTEGPCIGVCVIGVVSGSGCLGIDDDDTTRRCGNYAAGGIDMVNLINDMRADYP